MVQSGRTESDAYELTVQSAQVGSKNEKYYPLNATCYNYVLLYNLVWLDRNTLFLKWTIIKTMGFESGSASCT